MKNMNKTFETFEVFKQYSQTYGGLYLQLRYIKSYENQARLLTKLFHSTFFEELTQSNINDKFGFQFDQLMNQNLTLTIEILQQNMNLFETTNQISRSMSCFSTNRIVPVSSEAAIISAASSEDTRLLAGIVLMDNSTRELRSLDTHIQYKIRMDVDKVPLSSSLREAMWVPGPDGDMFYNMRYFWGFIQIQDLLDTAIMVSLGLGDNLGVYLQQFPYPCYRRDNFNSGLFTTQLIQVALVFGYSLVVGLSVREFLWERESRNLQLMRIMGVKYSAVLMSNFLFLLLIALVNSGILSVLMKYGGMLPYSDPFIVFFVLLAFGVANIMFIFLVSLVLSKSSSGSITAFLLFIITFLPFIIIVSLKEQIPTVVKILTNLFMSTSFGFSFLYITKFEQRSEGIHWNNYMESPIEGDQMSCFYCHLILIFDIFLYFGLALLIGKCASIDGTVTLKRSYRKKQSYEGSSNESRGIQISGLKKVYRIDRRQTRVAVDLEEVRFAENEITGLLGHNGAGKSTTMNMITGNRCLQNNNLHFIVHRNGDTI